jgi:hypothetical protein
MRTGRFFFPNEEREKARVYRQPLRVFVEKCNDRGCGETLEVHECFMSVAKEG